MKVTTMKTGWDDDADFPAGNHLHTLVRLSVALSVGLALAFLPNVTRNWLESGTLSSSGSAIRMLLLPGVMVAMIVARSAHDISPWVVDASDVAFYAWVSYLIVLDIEGKFLPKTRPVWRREISHFEMEESGKRSRFSAANSRVEGPRSGQIPFRCR